MSKFFVCQKMKLAREYECRRNEDVIQIGMNVLTTRPDDSKTGDALNFMIYWLKKAYAPDDLPSMHPEPALELTRHANR